MFPAQSDTPVKSSGRWSCFSASISYPWGNFSRTLWANEEISEGRGKGWQSEVVCPRLPRKGLVGPSSRPYLRMCSKAVGGWPQASCPLSQSQFSLVFMPLCIDDMQDTQWHTGDYRVGNSDKRLWYRSFWRTVTIKRREQCPVIVLSPLHLLLAFKKVFGNLTTHRKLQVQSQMSPLRPQVLSMGVVLLASTEKDWFTLFVCLWYNHFL